MNNGDVTAISVSVSTGLTCDPGVLIMCES